MGRPVVVTEIRPETGEVVIGEADAVFRTTLRADRLNWMSVPDIEGEARFLAKIRYNPQRIHVYCAEDRGRSGGMHL